MQTVDATGDLHREPLKDKGEAGACMAAGVPRAGADGSHTCWSWSAPDSSGVGRALWPSVPAPSQGSRMAGRPT